MLVQEVAGGLFEQRDFCVNDRFEIDVAGVAGEVCDALACDPVFAIGEMLQRNEQGVAGEG